MMSRCLRGPAGAAVRYLMDKAAVQFLTSHRGKLVIMLRQSHECC